MRYSSQVVYLGVMQALDKKQEVDDKQTESTRLKPRTAGGDNKGAAK